MKVLYIGHSSWNITFLVEYNEKCYQSQSKKIII